MTPEAALFLSKAQRLLKEAEAMLGIGLFEAAGRSAYLAAFQAAQAYISESTGRVAKTHKGVHTEFQRLTAADLHLAHELRSFLSRAYNLKAIADYETHPDQEVTAERAAQALAEAGRFVSHFSHLLAGNSFGR